MMFYNKISFIQTINLVIIVVIGFNSMYILLDNLEFDAMEIVDGIDGESNSESEVKEKFEFEEEIIKLGVVYNFTFKSDQRLLQNKKDQRIESLSQKILIPPPRS